ncbi:MAG: hypothetical protein WA777_21480 [Rhodanobacter sp.]
MQMLKLSVSLPDDTHSQLELHVSSNDSDYGVVIALPVRVQVEVAARTTLPLSAEDEYVLGGYAGI